MWKVVLGITLTGACTQAQRFQDLLLHEARHMVGVVVDAEGKPVAEAHVDHSNDRRQAHQTDLEGRFALDTRAPVLVVRKTGFRSELVRTQDATEVRIILQTLSESRAFPICSNTGQREGIEGWGSSFRFQRLIGVKASPQNRDIDYGARSYYVETQQGHRGIMHGSGPLWGFGTPSDLDVWRTTTYEETTFDVGGLTIIDARGQLPNGSRWRYLGKFGEFASYSDIDEATAKILDHFLDGACTDSAQRR